MTFADMFKKSILEGFNTDVTMGKVAAGLLAALLSALFIQNLRLSIHPCRMMVALISSTRALFWRALRPIPLSSIA